MIRFAIIGAGGIAHKFADAVRRVEGAEVTAVASKSMERAENFCKEENIENAFDSYDALFANGEFDAVYIATTNNFHVQNIVDALNAGKHVLCEKPMTMSEADSKYVCSLAEEKGLFLMEGLWTRFLPKTNKIREWIKDGKIGDVNLMSANVGWVTDPIKQERMYKKELGGGSTFDLAVYPLALLPYFTEQKIQSIDSRIVWYDKDIDDKLSLNLVFDRALGSIQCSFTTKFTEDAYLYGPKGYIHVPSVHLGNTAYLYDVAGNLVEAFEKNDPNGFVYEIMETISCINEGKLESTVCPHSMSIELGHWFDVILGK